MNKRKKRIYGAILLLALLALLLDRLSSGPAPSRAAGYTSRPLSDLGVVPIDTTTVSVAAAPFPSIPGETVRTGSVRDVFAATESVRKAMLSEEGRDGESGQTRGRGARVATATPASFEDVHRLKGVMSGARNSFAVVDDTWLRVGDTLDRCELLAVTPTTATFRCPIGEVTLSVVAPMFDDKKER